MRLISITSLALPLALCVGCGFDVDKERADRQASTANAGKQLAADELPEEHDGVPAEVAVTGITAVKVGGAPLEDPGAKVPIAVSRLMVTLAPTAGNDASGTLAFAMTDDGIRVEGELEGLTPGAHGFHVHQFGDCSGADGKTAGTHFNFAGSSENPPAGIQRITGNLGEIVADANGSAKVDVRVDKARIDGPFSIIGRSVIVHEKHNDEARPPMGAAGARLACGVIGIAKAPR